MRSFVPEFELSTPASLAEALMLIASGARPFAGGTDVMVGLDAGQLTHRHFVNLAPLTELRSIQDCNNSIQIGALSTYTDIANSSLIAKHFPMLAAAARQTGCLAIQNRGTIGGNIANASPAADSCPVLLAYDASILLRSSNGQRTIPYQQFHTGYKAMALAPGELIEAIRLPIRGGIWIDRFRKVGPRQAQAIAKLSLAASAQVCSGKISAIRIAFGGMAPTPLRCHRTEDQILSGQPWHLDELQPITDNRSTVEYRKQVAYNLMKDFIQSLNHE
ncbi:MAG: xanthine dehydrogenase family protein subunit M [Acidobacteria bacterium]|nr:xanthine dehydrogenase family protein subunit M [Acidobacteriota bacterium]